MVSGIEGFRVSGGGMDDERTNGELTKHPFPQQKYKTLSNNIFAILDAGVDEGLFVLYDRLAHIWVKKLIFRQENDRF